VAASKLPAVVARGEAGFPAEELREMAGIGVADVKGNGLGIAAKGTTRRRVVGLRFPRYTNLPVNPARRRSAVATPNPGTATERPRPQSRGRPWLQRQSGWIPSSDSGIQPYN